MTSPFFNVKPFGWPLLSMTMKITHGDDGMTGKIKPAFRTLPLSTILVILAILTGCAGPLQVTYDPAPAEKPVKVAGDVSVAIAGFTDSRTVEGPSARGSRTIGKASAVVANLSETNLTLSEDVTALVEKAFVRELAEAGYTVSPEGAGEGGAALVLAGEVHDFRLDIGPKDVISIDVSTEITDRATGRVVWSGRESYHEARYAGVMGNTRGSISRYISASLSKVVRAILTEATPDVSASMSGRPAVPVQAAPSADSRPPGGTDIPAGKGRLFISTTPPRAKVYIDEVYYGLTPISLDIEPGIYDLEIKLDGYNDKTEKVSVREGHLTEMELDFEK